MYHIQVHELHSFWTKIPEVLYFRLRSIAEVLEGMYARISKRSP